MPDSIPWDYLLEDSVLGRILLGVQARLRTLDLPGIGGDKIVIRKLPWVDDDTLQPPCVIISPKPEAIDWTRGTNERDDPTYSCIVAIVLANGRDNTTRGMGLQLAWRETVRRAFHNKSTLVWTDLALQSGYDFQRCYVSAGEPFIEAAKRMQYDAQYWAIDFIVREPRT